MAKNAEKSKPRLKSTTSRPKRMKVVLEGIPQDLGSLRAPLNEAEITSVSIYAAGWNRPRKRWYIILAWQTREHGFGQLTLDQGTDGGPLEIDTECMGHEFANKVVAVWMLGGNVTE